MNNKEIKKQLQTEFQQLQMRDIKKELMTEINGVTQIEPKSTQSNFSFFNRSFKMGLVCLSLAIIIGFFSLKPNSDEYIVLFDVNPNIELKLDQENRIKKVVCHNDDATKVIGDMDLEKTDLNVAVNAIIGSMFRNGYIDEIKNSILVTVQGNNEQKRKELKEQVATEVKDILTGYSVDAAVVSQDLGFSSDIEKLAKEHNISVGKATLIQELVQENSNYQFSDLTDLTINDLNTLVHYKNINFKTITIDGVESHDGYLSDEKLKELVLKHAKVDENDLKSYHYDMDGKDGRLIYEVQFSDAYAAYEYEVNVISGEIINFEVDVDLEDD